jgi:hypothetical protein
MPAKINMLITNGNYVPMQTRAINTASLASLSSVVPKPSPALNSSMLGRIHNAKAGCGSCGRH